VATHTNHPDVHEHGLADGCPRCTEQAHLPFRTLDRRALAGIIARLAAKLPSRSENEGAAMQKVGEAIEHARLLDEVAHQQLGIALFPPRAGRAWPREPWTKEDERRIRELRDLSRERDLTDEEQVQLMHLRQRETVETAERRRRLAR
jgi:hypothetical protein